MERIAVPSNDQTPPGPRANAIRLSRPRQLAILKALADPHRFQLFNRIACAVCPVGCGEVLAALSISPATLSHHIKELEAAGLVRTKRAGKFVFLHLRGEIWTSFLASLESIGQPRKTRA